MHHRICIAMVVCVLSTRLTADDATTRDRDFRIGKPQLALNAEGHTADVTALAYSPDGAHLFTASSDRTIRMWDTATGECLRVIRTPIAGSQFGVLYSCAVTRDGKLLATGEFSEAPGDPAAIYLISLETFEIVKRLEGHRGSVFGLEFSYDDKRLVSGSGWDKQVNIWDVASGRSIRAFNAPDLVWDAIFSPDGTQVATACYDGNAYLWSAQDGRRLATLRGHDGLVESIDWSRDGRTIATGGTDGTIRLWSYNGSPIKTFSNSIAGFVKSVQFSRDGRLLLASHLDALDDNKPVVSLIDIQRSVQVLKFRDHTRAVWNAIFSPDEQYIASTGGYDAATYIWNRGTGRTRTRMAARSKGLYAVAWGEDGKTIAWGTLTTAGISSVVTPTRSRSRNRSSGPSTCRDSNGRIIPTSSGISTGCAASSRVMVCGCCKLQIRRLKCSAAGNRS
ncbi:MAG: WD40 repeat domain-containing protein [Planctomycetaceae bacterium]